MNFQVGGSGGGSESSTHLDYNVAFLGDSIMTDNYGFYAALTNKYTFKSKCNLAKGGCKWAHVSDTERNINVSNGTYASDNCVTNQVLNLIDGVNGGTYQVPDIVFIHCGTNDAYHAEISSVTIENECGTPSTVFGIALSTLLAKWTKSGSTWTCNNTDLTTLSGGMRFAIELLRQAFPQVRILVSTPLYRGNGTYKDETRHINSIIKECASYLAVPILDLGYESGLTAVSGYTFTVDNTHPNTLGQLILADLLFAGLRRFSGMSDYSMHSVSGMVVNASQQAITSGSLIFVFGNNGGTTCTIGNGGAFTTSLPKATYGVLYKNGSTYKNCGTLIVTGDMSNQTIVVPN